MNQVVFFLEERSAREMLKNLLPRILPDNVTIRYVVFEGKQDLEKQLEKKTARMACARHALCCHAGQGSGGLSQGQVPSDQDLPGRWKAERTGPNTLP